MKILLATGIYLPEGGGPAIYTHQLAMTLRTLGHTAKVITYGDVRTAVPDITVVSRSGGPMIRYLRYLWKAFWLARSLEVVYAQGAVSEGLPAALAARLAHRPLVMRIPGDYAWEMAQQRGEKALLDEFLTKKTRGIIALYNKIERWTAHQAKNIIVPSQYLGRVVRAWGVAQEKIHVIHSTITPLPETAGRSELRARESWKEDDVILLTNVRAVPWKGVDFLLSVLRDLPSNYYFVSIGEGPELEKWKKCSEEYGLASRTRFLGRVNRQTVAEWCRMADVFVLASGYEGFAHVLVEAVSEGLPCVVSDKAGNPEAKELFPDHVTVLPYQDHKVWVQILSKDHPRLLKEKIESFEEVVRKTLCVF